MPDSRILDAAGRPIALPLGEIGRPSTTDPYKFWMGNLKSNPDPILKNKAGTKGLAFFEAMLVSDTKLFSLFQTRTNGLLGKKREIVAASDDPNDQEIRDFVADAIDSLENFEQDLRELCDAIPKGWAVSEVTWKIIDKGDWKGKVGIDRILSRDQTGYGFHRETNELLMKQPLGLDGIPVPPRKFLVHSFNPKHENPYGSAVLSYCYWAYFFKKHSVKWWSVFNEKFGSPTVIGKYQRGLATEDQSTLQDIIERIKTETGIVMPDDIAIDLLEAKISGNVQTHKQFIDLMDKWEAQAVLGGTLTADAGEKGARSLGDVHDAVRAEYVRGDAESLMGVINHQLIRWLVDWNYPNVEKYPAMQIDVDPAEDLKEAAEVYEKIIKGLKLPVAKRHLYEKFNIPEPAEDEELLELPKPPPNLFAPSGAAQSGNGGEGGSPPPPDPNAPNAPFAEGGGGFVAFADLPDNLTPDQKRRARRAINTPEEITQQAARLGRRIFSTWIETAKRVLLKGLADSDPLTPDIINRLDKLPAKLDVDPLARLIEATNIYAHLRGGHDILLDAKLETEQVEFASWPAEFSTAINFLKRKSPRTRKQFDLLTAAGQAKAFTVKLPWISARKGRQRIIGEIQDALLTGLRGETTTDPMTGQPKLITDTVDDFKVRVDDIMDRAGVDPLNPWHVETIFRTNVQDAYNAGRWQMLNDPDVADMVVAYEYIAILDARTRPDHAAMNGKIYAKDDPIWLSWWPPNGYNCRCTTIAIFAGEQWDPSSETSLQPDDGFARNSGALQQEAAA